MPIVVKDFSWWQTDCKVFVQVQIPHVSQKNSDVLTSNKYLKVSVSIIKNYIFGIVYFVMNLKHYIIYTSIIHILYSYHQLRFY